MVNPMSLTFAMNSRGTALPHEIKTFPALLQQTRSASFALAEPRDSNIPELRNIPEILFGFLL